MMDKDYLVFWRDCGRPVAGAAENQSQVNVVRVVHPPHDEPRGTILREFVEDALEKDSDGRAEVFGIVELGNPAWSAGANREITMGDGRPGILECTRAGWQVRVAQ